MSGPRPAVRAVVFDLDDTLYAERDYVRSGYRAVAAHLADGGRQSGGADADEMFHWLWGRFLGGQAGGAFDALSDRFRLGLTPPDVAELVEVYRGHRPLIRPFGDAAELLSLLRARCRLAVLSDGFLPAQSLKLDALGLRRFFDAVVFTEEMGRSAWKPSPAGFERVAELLGTAHHACCYVADNPAKDFVAPNALGWRTVQYVRIGQLHAANAAPAGGEAQVLAHSTLELLAALR